MTAGKAAAPRRPRGKPPSDAAPRAPPDLVLLAPLPPLLLHGSPPPLVPQPLFFQLLLPLLQVLLVVLPGPFFPL